MFFIREVDLMQDLRGISASGKSRAATQLLQHLTWITKTIGNEKPIDYYSSVYDALLVLTAFGAAKTQIHSSASKVISAYECVFSSKHGGLRGINIHGTLLDERRVIRGTPTERNFHIFYSLLAGLTPSEKAECKLPVLSLAASIAKFKILSANRDTTTTSADELGLEFVRNAASRLGFSNETMQQLFKVLSAILHLGNIEFMADKNKVTSDRAPVVRNPEHLQAAAELLGVSSESLEMGLGHKLSIVRGEVFGIVLEVSEAQKATSTLAKILYNLLYNKIRGLCNQKVGVTKLERSRRDLDVHIVDLLSTEDIHAGNIEHLNVAFAEERVLSFTYKVFVQSQLEESAANFPERKLPYNEFSHMQNTEQLDLLIGPGKLFDTLNNYAVEEDQRKNIYQATTQAFANHSSFTAASDSQSFSIRHFHAAIEYNAFDLVEANTNTIADHYIHLFFGDTNAASVTRNSFVKCMFQEFCIGSKPHPHDEQQFIEIQHRGYSLDDKIQAGRPMTLLRNFELWLSEKVIPQHANLWQIICIRPNHNLTPESFDLQDVLGQSKRFFLADITRAQINDCQISFTYENITLRYNSIFPGIGRLTSTNKAAWHSLRQLLDSQGNATVIEGKSQLFMSFYAWRLLENTVIARIGERSEELDTNFRLSAQLDDVPDPSSNTSRQTSTLRRPPIAASQNDLAGFQTTTLRSNKNKITVIRKTPSRRFWVAMSFVCTFWAPSAIMKLCGLKSIEVQQAWREKVTICLIIAVMSACAIGVVFGLQFALCPTSNLITAATVATHYSPKSAWVTLYQNVYDVTNYDSSMNYNEIGRDISIYPRVSSDALQSSCATILAQQGIANAQTPWAPVVYPLTNDTDTARRLFADLSAQQPPLSIKGIAGYASTEIQYHKYASDAWTVIGDNIYNLTEYNLMILSNQLKNIFPLQTMTLIANNIGQTVSSNDAAKIPPAVQQCLDGLFIIGQVIPAVTLECRSTSLALFAFLCISAAIQLAKFVSAMFAGVDFSSRRSSNPDKHVIIQIPCYTEGEASLRKTIDTCALSVYPDDKTLLMVVCDGMVMGSGEKVPTPIIAMDILGVPSGVKRASSAYQALGDGSKQLNFAKVYTGFYSVKGSLQGEPGHQVPFLLIAKCGKPTETLKPGNRGKRDSQVLSFRFLQKVQHKQPLPMTPMELDIYSQMRNVIGIEPHLYEYMLMVDADTEVLEKSLAQLVLRMEQDKKIMGLTGETLIRNQLQSWTTSIQVYEYYISHHLFKAFESFFGTVTCLPGCFTMWRLKTMDKGEALLIDPNFIAEYCDNTVDTLHKRNLFHLGEDRYMTSLMIKRFPYYTTKYIPFAKCRTIVPDNIVVFFSQRRRWVNSTLHNLFELCLVKNLCGLLCFSMRFMVMVDLLSTIMIPVLTVYTFYLIVETALYQDPGMILNMCLGACIYALQLLVCLMDGKVSYIFWFLVNILALPVTSFFLPLYCFWHQDDFSWGATRAVAGDNSKESYIVEDEFDVSQIPLQNYEEFHSHKVTDYAQENSVVDNMTFTARGGTLKSARSTVPRDTVNLVRDATMKAHHVRDNTIPKNRMSTTNSSRSPSPEAYEMRSSPTDSTTRLLPGTDSVNDLQDNRVKNPASVAVSRSNSITSTVSDVDQRTARPLMPPPIAARPPRLNGSPNPILRQPNNRSS